jgi:hypothetical protein
MNSEVRKHAVQNFITNGGYVFKINSFDTYLNPFGYNPGYLLEDNEENKELILMETLKGTITRKVKINPAKFLLTIGFGL